MRGSGLPPCQILIASREVLVEICNGNHVWHVSTPKCEAVIFAKLGSACVYTRPLDYLDALVLHRAHAPCMHTCIMHARCDVIQFAYNANHVTMMSVAFAFH